MESIKIKEKEIYDLKHELISEQIKTETNEKTIKEMELQNKELVLQKTKLEAALEDALLGRIEEDQEKASADQKSGAKEVTPENISGMDFKKSKKK